MTDEERQKQILQRLAQLGTIGFHDPDIACQWILDGHDEIERLAAENKRLEHELRLWREQG
jgi:hypothetical protein